MEKLRVTRLVFIITLILCVGIFLLLLSSYLCYVNDHNLVRQNAINQARGDTNRAVKELDMRLRSIGAMTDSLAGGMDASPMDIGVLEQRLELILRSDPAIMSAGYLAGPAMDNPGQYFQGITWVRDQGPIAVPGSPEIAAWYQEALAAGPRWNAPRFDQSAKRLVVTYTVPVRSPGAKPADQPQGIVFAAISDGKLRQLMTALDMGQATHCTLFTGDGIILYHLVRELSAASRTIFDIATWADDKDRSHFREAARRIKAKQEYFMETGDAESGESLWVIFQPVPASGWSIACTFVQEDLFDDPGAFRHRRIKLALGLILFLTLLSVLIFRAYEANQRGLWITSIIFSLLCAGGVAFVWHVAASAPPPEIEDSYRISGPHALQHGVNKLLADARRFHRDLPVLIPTGIEISTLEFTSASNLAITGQIWQKYPHNVPPDISRGFYLPEASKQTIVPIYQRRLPDYDLHGWHFEAVLREAMDYSKYPFDRPDVWVWIRHQDFDRSILLIPDLDAYKVVNPAAFPGLQDELYLPGYRKVGTYFDYRALMSNTTFGFSNPTVEMIQYELFFNVILERNFITPFISKILPLLIIWSILYIVQLSFTKDPDHQPKVGLNTLSVVAVTVTFFFTVLMSQIDMRQNLAANKIIFIENFHILTYFILLVVAINIYLFNHPRHFKIIDYRNGLVLKLIYWPLLSAAVLVISLLHFY